MFHPRTDVELAVATTAAELAEAATRKHPPFDKVAVKAGLDDYEPLVKQWSSEQRARLVDAAVAIARFSVAGELFRDDSAFALFSALDAQLKPLLAQRRPPATGEQWLARESFSMKERQTLLRAEMERHFPEFALTNRFFGRAVPGMLVFTRSFLPDSRLFIAPYLGKNQHNGRFQCFFGLERPFYSETPGTFYFCNLVGVYYTPEDLRAAIEENFRLLSPLLHAFGERMQQVLKGRDLTLEQGPHDPLVGQRRT